MEPTGIEFRNELDALTEAYQGVLSESKEKSIGKTKSGKTIFATGNRGKKSEGWTPQDHLEAKKHHDREVDRLLSKKPGPTVSKDVSKEMERLRQHSQFHFKQSKKTQRELDGKRKFED